MESPELEDIGHDVKQQWDATDDISLSVNAIINEYNMDVETVSSEVAVSETPSLKNVKFTVSISLGMSCANMPDPQILAKKTTKLEVTKPTGFYHVEFKLLPNNNDVSQVDVVVYDYFARVYTDKADVKTCKLYYLNNVAWISWDQKFTVTISDSLLLQMFDYKIEFLLWDNKEKMMARAKFDKPRSIKCDVEENEMKKCVDKQHEHLLQLEKHNPQNVSYIFEPVETDQRINEDGNIFEMSNDTSNISIAQTTETLKKNMSTEKKQKNKKKELVNRKAKALAKIVFKMCHFFSDTLFIIKHLSWTPVGLIDMVVSINISENLLSTEQRRMFNPMVICIHSVNDMPGKDPSEGVTYEQLKENCQPVYVKYEFLNSLPYKTCAKSQKRNIHFNDLNVILAGRLDQIELKEYFRGPGLKIEIHDRDRNIVMYEKQNLLFGDDINDDKFNNINYLKNKKGRDSPNQSPLKLSDTYGICKLDFLELIQGCKYLYREISILHQRPEKVSSKEHLTDSTESLSMLSTPKYLECNSVLKVNIKLAYPFIERNDISLKRIVLPNNICPFSRVIFKIDEKHKDLIHAVLLTIAKLNGNTLGLDNVADHVLISILSTFVLTIQQQSIRMLDIITGFHFIDKNIHLIVVEGLQYKALAKLVTQFQNTDVSGFTILHNTDFVCTDRLYVSLNLNILKIKLSLPLSAILEQPLLYVRNVVPKPCFDALIQVSQLIECNRLMDAVYNNLFPDAVMMQSMNNIFGSMTSENLKLEAMIAPNDKEDIAVDTKERVRAASKASLLKIEKASAPEKINFIKHNADLVHLQSEENRMNVVPQKTVELKHPLMDMQNYSICTFNSIEMAKEELLNTLDMTTLYTYCPEFHHSMTFSPVNESAVKCKRYSLRKIRKWVPAEQKTILQRHAQIRKPSEGRLEELYQPYEEFCNYPRRDIKKCQRSFYYTWKDRKYDFDLWKNQPTKLSEYVHVIRSPQDKESYMKELKQKEFDSWKSKVIVSNTQEKFCRLLINTELLVKGPKASCQLDRLKGLLKDKPEKLAYTIYPTSQIPALGVVNYPELENKSKGKNIVPSYSTYHPEYETEAFLPGPLWPERRLIMFGNQTPMYNYEHQNFIKLKGQEFITTQRINPPHCKWRQATTIPLTEKRKYEIETLKKSNALPPLNIVTSETSKII